MERCNPLLISSHVCSRHFDESDIEKGKDILNVFHPFVRWQLKPGSYPKRILLDSDYPQELIRKRAGGSLINLQKSYRQKNGKC